MPNKSPAKTRAERGQELRNIWANICMFLTEAERADAGISEDRSMTVNTLRAFDFLASAKDRASSSDVYRPEEIDEAIQALRRSRFFGCCTSSCKTNAPTCDYCLRFFAIEGMLQALRNRLARGCAAGMEAVSSGPSGRDATTKTEVTEAVPTPEQP